MRTRNHFGGLPLILVAGVIAAGIATLSFAQVKKGGKTGNTNEPQAPAGLKTYQTPYYVMATDLSPEDVQEASLRMTRMAEEYHERTKSFSGAINKRMPFWLFQNAEDYYAAGAPPGTAGVYMHRGDEGKLMAIAGEKTGNRTWHVVQHEGFHQFAHNVIGGELPIWVNEGLAEYFGESIWSGDGFVTGIIPPRRLVTVKESIKAKRFKTIKAMMLFTHEAWNLEGDIRNYDMAWSMVHFLAHGDNGAYQSAFSNFMQKINRKVPWDKAWIESFGSAEAFEKKWSEWWLKQEGDPTADLYSRATLSILTSFVARVHTAKAPVTDLTKFVDHMKTEVKLTGDDWLPPKLFDSAVAGLKRDETKFSIEAGAKGMPPKVVAVRTDGTRMVGTFPARASRPVKVAIEVDDMAPSLAQAREVLKAGKKQEAATLVQNAIRRNPKSSAIDEARKLLLETK